MDWSNPSWAGFAVAFCSLGTTGESVSKGLLCLCGTLLGAVVALTLLALFPQDRWLFMAAMVSWVAFGTYRLLGTPHWYFWHVAGFVVPLLSLSSGPFGLNAFETVVLRTQQTALGFLCFSLVWLFLWPSSTAPTLRATLRRLVDLQRQLLALQLDLANGGNDDGGTGRLAQQAAPIRASLADLLDGAVIDSLDIGENRGAWQRCVALLGQTSDRLALWHESLEAVDTLPLERYLPGSSAFAKELDRRFAAVARELSGESPDVAPTALDLGLDASAIAEVSHFQRAALVACVDQMRDLDRITSELVALLAAIQRDERVTDVSAYTPAPVPYIDLERLAYVARISTALTLACLAAIFVPDLPNTVVLITLATALSTGLARFPYLAVASISAIMGYVVAVVSLIYVFVLPQLSSFVGLSIVLFSAIFAIAYIFHEPRQALTKSASLALFVILFDISNQQSYSFLHLANYRVVLLIVMAVLMTAVVFPISFKPEHVFFRLLGRFFSSAAALSAMRMVSGNEPQGVLQRYRMTYHGNVVARVPAQLALWARFIPRAALGAATPDRVQAMVATLQVLAYRMQGVTSARGHPQAAALLHELGDDGRDCREKVEDGSTASAGASPPMTVSLASSSCRTSARPSNGSAWRSAFLCAST